MALKNKQNKGDTLEEELGTETCISLRLYRECLLFVTGFICK